MENAGREVDGDVLSVYFPRMPEEGPLSFPERLLSQRCRGHAIRIRPLPVPSGKALHISHTGAYENLGNAWSRAHQYARYKKLKLAKTNSYEIYRNSPETTAAEDLITDIYLPLR